MVGFAAKSGRKGKKYSQKSLNCSKYVEDSPCRRMGVFSCPPPRRLLASATLASWSPVLNTPGPVPASGPSHLLLPLPGMLSLTCKELRVSLPYFLQVSAQMSLSQGGEP